MDSLHWAIGIGQWAVKACFLLAHVAGKWPPHFTSCMSTNSLYMACLTATAHMCYRSIHLITLLIHVQYSLSKSHINFFLLKIFGIRHSFHHYHVAN